MKTMLLGTITIVTFLFSTKCNAISYRDHLLIHVIPKSDTEIDFFKRLRSFYNITFWKKPTLVDKPFEFSLSRFNFAELLRDTKDMNIDFITVIRDLQSVFDKQTLKRYLRRRMETFDWQNYYSVVDIYNWLRDIKDLHPNTIKIDIFGQSVQGRDLLAVRIDTEPKETGRSSVVVEGGCHAREWISPAVVTYMINTILNAKHSNNSELKLIARSYKWIFVPLLNPDGYAYSQTNDRLWRKNYHEVDLNRNFGVSFRSCDSVKKNDEEYCGSEPFSEPETRALATYLKDNSKTMDYYLAFHSYGQYIIIPYAYSKDHAGNFETVKKYSDAVAERSWQKYKIRYTTGTAYDTVGYLASGTSPDWVKFSLEVPYVVTFELPDQGNYGFSLPDDQISSTCEATMDSVLAFLTPKNDTKLRLQYSYDHNQKKSASGAQQHRSFETVVICSLLFCFKV